MDNLVRITSSITFDDLKTGKKSPIDVYEEQIKSWLLIPLKQLSKDKYKSFENGYAMFALELLFFEPHGKYINGNTVSQSGKNFRKGFDEFLKFLETKKYIDSNTLSKIKSINFYGVSRCGIYHAMTIKSGLLIDSVHMEKDKVFYNSPINNGILVSPWNFLIALEEYFESHLKDLRASNKSKAYKNFLITFKDLFQY